MAEITPVLGRYRESKEEEQAKVPGKVMLPQKRRTFREWFLSGVATASEVRRFKDQTLIGQASIEERLGAVDSSTSEIVRKIDVLGDAFAKFLFNQHEIERKKISSRKSKKGKRKAK